MTRAVAFAAAAVFICSAARAQPICGPRQKFIEHLARQHREQPVAVGLMSNGQVLELLTAEGGSWTVIATQANGRSCVVAAGEAWEVFPPDRSKLNPPS